jgi:outer membrane protein OmpA-like peptidoglycan-associated protein
LAGALVLAVVATWAPGARANDTWFLLGETSAGVPLGEAQQSLYASGGSAAVAGYRSVGRFVMAGLRLRAGVFGAGAGTDPSNGLGALSFALRLTPLAQPVRSPKLGLWMEGVGGGGLAGSLAPIIEAGIGLGFLAGSTVLGPSIRYLQVVPSGSTGAKVLLLGLEVAFYDKKKAELPYARLAAMEPLLPPPPAPAPAPAPVPAPVPPPNASSRDADGDTIADVSDRCPEKAEDTDGFQDDDGCPEEDNDGDHVLDASDRCPDKAEVVNGVDDGDGCPDVGGAVQVIDDRIVLDNEVMFDSERARVRTAGQRVLAAVVDLWRKHPEWERLEVEGHADPRGPEKFNQWLSEERAQRVRATLIRLGAPEGKITAKGFGATRPRTGGGDLNQSRRVELVVIRKSATTAPMTPVAP